ncbi:MAG TPA: YbaN family protein [Candidatus Avacidaminococcus intestinavium]|uniref:YbaN family protein n=1 Tax=Candidatus Avacidaminococcus intestinavium TaxID=2840684 RepID=A0A9D1MQ05_9FIRM|nr:YbaN family protein [Candidatus Avacidaminococcus intestinavium]
MKHIYVGLGCFFLVLGTIGVFLPILPTVPFLLLASYFFAKGSGRFHRWFTSTKLYHQHLQPFEENRALPLGTKWRILLLASLMIAIPFLKIDNIYMRAVIICLVIVKYYIILFRIETAKP